jgi:hypothetical protein
MADLVRLVLQLLAAIGIVAFFLLGALVIFGTVAACFRSRQPSGRAAVARREATLRGGPGTGRGPTVRTQPEDPRAPATV